MIDFGFTNKETLVNPWGGVSSDIFGDISAWKSKLRKSNTNANVLVVGQDVAEIMLKDEKFQKLYDLKSIDNGSIVPKDVKEGGTFIGTMRLQGIDIYQYESYYEDDDGVVKPFIPEGHVVMASSNYMGKFIFGAVTLLGEDGNWETFESEYVPQYIYDQDANTSKFKVYSKPLPVPFDVDSWISCKVI